MNKKKLGSCGFHQWVAHGPTFIPLVTGSANPNSEFPPGKPHVSMHPCHPCFSYCIEVMTHEGMLLLAADQMPLADGKLVSK